MKILLKSNPAERMGLTRQKVADGNWYGYQHLFDLEYFKDVPIEELELDNDYKYLWFVDLPKI